MKKASSGNSWNMFVFLVLDMYVTFFLSSPQAWNAVTAEFVGNELVIMRLITRVMLGNERVRG